MRLPSEKASGKDFLTGEEIAEGRNAEQERIFQALREAKPEFLRDGFGLRGPQVPTIKRTTDFSQGEVIRQQVQNAFPGEEVQQAQVSTGVAVPNIAFILSNASTSESGTTVNKVKVFDGKINGVFPSGMGFDNYVLTISDPADAIIYAGATFNPSSLAITSRFLGVSTASSFPESRVDETGGYLYWQLGFTFLDDDTFTIVSTRVGDINFELVYGSMNGLPALLPVDTGPGFLDLESLYPL